ncbi:MAG TPA: alpha/beta hydrolase fold domain-containing protein [Rhodocyclaceae bacterium]|nr:alpha/beta hydrolase fold domain-containing protein [Rhodocyclaceae bacterium]HMV55271.1 alpha/beta hydrolase fold domain-containing protein [Rhodocyclaceae bacterium]HMZ85005.1 alpha/beta hydrolase fold domain-containing protein [Rhodocyclaceae bacterium]HNB80247.1 alpha/beta hydrolase fold domain-containing protein [Rhodocyclaceae bacterium]HNC62963.1 alpha/beta hydrolase fold domain-containing protein [Rhodocyclaceae bacterium]
MRTGFGDVEVVPQRLHGYVRDLDARLYVPVGAPTSALVVYLHEGGFVGGDLDTAHAAADAAARTLACRVLAVAYSLAPAEPFPAALEDVLGAVAWARHAADSVIVAGTEAGGNLAAAAALATRDRGFPALRAQVLITPMLDPTLSSHSMVGTALAAQRSARCCFACYRSYLPTVSDRMHPYAAPATATRLAGLAPAFIVTAADDPLRGEAEQYAERLERAGVATRMARSPSLADMNADTAWPWREVLAWLPTLADATSRTCSKGVEN